MILMIQKKLMTPKLKVVVRQLKKRMKTVVRE